MTWAMRDSNEFGEHFGMSEKFNEGGVRMPGFRYCQWCNGKGCIVCDAEKKKFEAKAAAQAPKWREPDIRDVRDAAVKAEQEKAMRGEPHLTEEEVEAAFKPALDAEYERQFPGGPKPIFTAKRDNPADMALLHNAMSIGFKEGNPTEDTVKAIIGLLTKANVTQAARQVLIPNEQDAAS